MYMSHMSVPGAPGHISQLISEDDVDPLLIEGAPHAEDAQHISDTLFNGVPLLGLNSYDFQFNVAFSSEMVAFEDGFFAPSRQVHT